MEGRRNPFTPTFGMVPPFLAGRDRLLREMSRAFEDGPGNPNLSTILIGARGTGKTTLLSRIGDVARSHGWLTVDAVAVPGMLEDIIQQAGKAAAHLVEREPGRRLSAVGLGQLLSLEWVFSEPETSNWRARIEALLEKIEQQGSALLITVDEVTPSVDEVVMLASIYQLLIREGHKVALVMAGLPSDVTALISDERASFLRRARQRHIGRIDETEVRLALRRTIESAGKTIEDGALDSAARATDGFAYMLQLVGYFAWEEARNRKTLDPASVMRGIEEARDDFSRGVLDATYREMSRKDREFALAMLKDEHGSRLTDIADRMGVSNGYASTYKRRLLGQGVIGERPGGLLDFDIPLMRTYLSEFSQD